MKRTEKIKKHFHDNKKVYLSCGVTAIVTAVGTILYVNSRNATPQISASLIDSKNVLSYKPETTNKVVFKIDALGDPGNVVRDVTTGDVYPSQAAAARALDVAPARITENLQGKLDNVQGHAFEVLGKAGSTDVVASR